MPEETNEPAPVSRHVPEPVTFKIQEVKYSLPQMLRELEQERAHSYFAKEIIDQIEISKLFAQAKKARGKRK